MRPCTSINESVMVILASACNHSNEKNLFYSICTVTNGTIYNYCHKALIQELKLLRNCNDNNTSNMVHFEYDT